MSQTKTYFLTGATGLLGSYLTKVLLENKHTVYVLARPKNNKTAQQRVHNILNFWDKNTLKKYPSNLFILEGDIIKNNLGLNTKNLAILTDKVNEIFHCAADTNFFGQINKLRKINVEGVRNLLTLGTNLTKNGSLRKINHISTAFVAGNHQGEFKETDLNVNQKFNNHYEQTKFEAELVVEEFRKKNLSINVFRPAVVVGESRTGKTSKFEHIYQLLSLWGRETIDIFPIKKVPLYLTSVDIVAKAIYSLSHETNALNINYHLFTNKTILTTDFFDVAKNSMGFKAPVRVAWNFDTSKLSTAQRNLINSALIFNKMLIKKLSSTSTLLLLRKISPLCFTINKNDILNIIQYAIKSGYLKNK